MADTVTSQTLENGARNLVMHFTNVSDGTGEAAVTKVNASTLGLSIHLKVRRIKYNVTGGAIKLMWDATSDVNFAYLSGYGELDLTFVQGIPNSGGVGVTGTIQLTTSGFIAQTATVPASGYTLTLFMTKGD